MRRIIIPTLAAFLIISPSPALAEDADKVGYMEDFEGYNYTAIYNSEDMTVSYDERTASILSSQKFIINAAGGIYGEDEAYTANAAENICCYAKTGEGEGIAVFGGLGNGWHGRYSHPPNTLDGKGGANGELNPYNRRLAVMPLSGNKVLQMNPAQNDYVSTYSIYANDDQTFFEHTKWSTDVYLASVSGGYFSVYLSKGEMNAPRPLEYLSGVDEGRELLELLRFSSENGFSFLGEAAGEYTPANWYTVSVLLDRYDDHTDCTVQVMDRQNGVPVWESEKTGLDFILDDSPCGLGYTAYTPAKNSATNVYIDNISVEPLVFTADLASTREVAINGKGNTAIKFSSEYVDESISTDTVKVYLGEEEIEGVSLSLLSQNRVRITLPSLLPAREYTIVVKDVLGQNGIYADCRIPFKTVSLITASSASVSGENVSVKLNNNSLDETHVTIVAIGENDDGAIETTVYKRIGLIPEGTATEELSGVVTDSVKTVHLYVIDSVLGRVVPLSDDITLVVK